MIIKPGMRKKLPKIFRIIRVFIFKRRPTITCPKCGSRNFSVTVHLMKCHECDYEYDCRNYYDLN